MNDKEFLKQFASELSKAKRGYSATDLIDGTAEKEGIVIVSGLSDDRVGFGGAIDDEVGCFDGGTIHFDANGDLINPDNFDDGCDDEEYLEEIEEKSVATIEAIWDDAGDPVWYYETEIPHETFNIKESDNSLYCIGICFYKKDVGGSQ